MPLAALFGWNDFDWEATIGLVGVFFVVFPLMVNGIVMFIAAQVIGERNQNQAYARGEDVGGQG
jgi:phage shock protein PspC (stress-responsive transcriptional regulator)